MYGDPNDPPADDDAQDNGDLTTIEDGDDDHYGWRGAAEQNETDAWNGRSRANFRPHFWPRNSYYSRD